MQILTDSENDILSNFKVKFAHLKKSPVVLYGLGEKTKLLLENCKEFNFVALMDKNSIGALVFQKPVIAPEVVTRYAKIIIIVSTYSSVDAIFQRISSLKEQGVDIYYMNGDKLNYEAKNLADFEYDFTASDLKEAIQSSDIVSFDVFDTLITRKLPYPTDVFEVVQHKIKQIFSINKDFVTARIQAEKAAQKIDKNYDLDLIYFQMPVFLNISNEKLEKIKNIEIETEINFSVKREGMFELVNFALQSDKVVHLTSDMYLRPADIKKILKNCGLNSEVLNTISLNVSNEIKKSKYAGDLFDYYLEKFPGKKILHVGDDDFADIKQAKSKGLSTFKILTKSEIYEAMLSRNNRPTFQLSIDDKIMFGHFLSFCFSNPFCISKKSPIIKIKSITDIGYLFFGPLIYNYLVWLNKEVGKRNLDKILFIARDGYILEMLYTSLPDKKGKSVYCFTSRRSAGVCSIETEEDIRIVFNVYYSARKILVSQFINSAFGILISDLDPIASKYVIEIEKDELLEYILNQYGQQIILNAEVEREEYNAYIKRLGINPGDKLAVINLVGTGATQLFMEKVFKENEIEMFYFATTIDMKNVSLNLSRVFALYGEFLSTYTCIDNALIRHYLMAESVFSAPQEQFVKFVDSKPMFKEDSGERSFSRIKECHDGIEAFFHDMIKVDNFENANLNPKFTEFLFGLMFDERICYVSDDIKSAFTITDGFSSGKTLTGLW